MAPREGTPAEAALDPEPLRQLDGILEGHLAARAFPGAVVAIGHQGVLGWLKAYGRTSYQPGAPAVEVDTLYDLASLTKVVVTATLAMMLVDEGCLDLDAPAAAYLPGFAGGGRERVTVRQLLTHSSGLDWWAPLYQELRGPQAYLERIQAMDLVYAPGSKALYSDLGVILLGALLQRVAGRGLEELARERILDPLGMRDTGYRPDASLRPRIAPTEVDAWRGWLVHGEVHDENAWALGGVAPHAGLFGSARDLARFAQMLLAGGVCDGRRLVRSETLRRFTRRDGSVAGSTRALGWDTPADAGDSSAGRFFSRSSFGHTGFTGTSLWIDPERSLFAILLSNRVHPTRESSGISQARADVADAAVRAALGREPEPQR
jgi:CubicO group peptidase (beta-lactamase class C family)